MNADGLTTSNIRSPNGDASPWTFVSIPDFLNLDVGDIKSGVGWRPGMPNSTNADYETLLAQVLDSVAAENPDLVLVAGDLVGGLWHRDDDDLHIFGPTKTLEDKRQTVLRAGHLYYTQWLERFERRGLEVHTAVGDHEIGDNPWRPGTDKYSLFPAFKRAWATAFSRSIGGARYLVRPVGTDFEHTAYAFRHRDTLFVTVDVFNRVATGVEVGVGDRQLEWLADVLRRGRSNQFVRHVIVQGHVPVLTPVRMTHSSGLVHELGPDSAFWHLLEDHGVELYLCGEVHDVTATDRGSLIQIAHGANIGRAPRLNYLIGKVYPDRLVLGIKQADQLKGNRREQLWQVSRRRPNADVKLGSEGFVMTGTLTVDTSTPDHAILERTGSLSAFDPHQAASDELLAIGA